MLKLSTTDGFLVALYSAIIFTLATLVYREILFNLLQGIDLPSFTFLLNASPPDTCL